jgi:hypothetical protein
LGDAFASPFKSRTIVLWFTPVSFAKVNPKPRLRFGAFLLTGLAYPWLAESAL